MDRLAGHVSKGTLCDQIIVSSPAWENGRNERLAKISICLGDAPFLVRSSAATEDSWDNSLAGVHLSVVDVAPSVTEIADAIDRVFASYHQTSPHDEVLVQPMVTGVVLSGVVITRELNTGSPYYTINYDDFTGRTDTVTGGGESKSVLVHRSKPEALKSSWLRKLIDCIMEIEAVTGIQELDIEFCITWDEDVYILQVRPLAASRQWKSVPDAAVDHGIDAIRVKLEGLMGPEEGLAGQSTILSEMTDWNPAEMIGNAPRPLALSLYKSLITDRVWADARAQMGYRKVAGPLLIDLQGRPYIDVRKSLNSFLPDGIDEGTVGALVDHQLRLLSENRGLHDKVEFEIAVTCRDFSLKKARQRLKMAGLDNSDVDAVETALGVLTRTLLEDGESGISRLVEETDRLLEPLPEQGDPDPIGQVGRLLDVCRAHGVLPFAKLARHGFIAVQLLKSMVERGALTPEDAEDFMHSIKTVATELTHDMHAVSSGKTSEQDFLARYGHLRPGTYDIASWRYDERPELYLGHSRHGSVSESLPFAPTPVMRKNVETLLEETGYGLSADALLDYIAAAVRGREQAKFAFTRALSDALSALAQWGEDAGLSRDALSYLPINAFLGGDKPEALKAAIEKNREDYALTRAIRLPHLISELSDVDVIRLPLGHPTFITAKTVTAETRRLPGEDTPDINGHIVLIESADPGFDWIFSHDIKGLITKYGGANSHMAIRSAEFGLPAAIGCGERLFESLARAPVVELDCAAQKVVVQ